MSQIYKTNTLYRLGRKYVVWVFKNYYDEYIVLGKENIPVGEPLIIAPNHLNALMDAIAILSLPPSDMSKVYLSRADLFNLPKLIVRFLRFAKLVPAFRIRDGYENLDKNKASFDEAEDVLINNAAVVIMPEGNQGEEKKIRPLVKGIFRIAFSAQMNMPAGKSVKILPVGIDMGHLMKFGKHIIINISKPIDIADYTKIYQENPATAINQLKSRLKIEMENLVQNLATEKYYSCFETAIDVVGNDMLKELQLSDNTVNRFYTGQKAAAILVELEKNYPQETEQLDALCKAYKEGLQKVNLRSENLEKPAMGVPALIITGLLNIIYVLIGLPGFLLNILPFKIPTLFVKILNIEYKGFYSSVYFGFSILSFPLMYTIQSIIILSILALPWWVFFLLLPIHYYSGKFSFLLYKRIKAYFAKLRLKKLVKSNMTGYSQLKEIKKQISEIIFKQLKT
jgi:1-acyl-sn-glycerol-3-phosphate acyltransferase